MAHMVWLRGYADYLSIAYPDASFTMESYDSFLESGEAKVFSSVAVWDSQGEQAVSAEASGQSVRADIYMMGGHLQAVFGDTLFRGRYFTAGEEGVCLIDLRTAEELFGSRNVVGRSLVLGGEDYRITGLVDSGRKICVISPEEGALFHGVTVRKQTAEQSSDNAKAVLSAYFGGSEHTGDRRTALLPDRAFQARAPSDLSLGGPGSPSHQGCPGAGLPARQCWRQACWLWRWS